MSAQSDPLRPRTPLGALLLRARLDAGLTQVAAAAKTRVSTRTWVGWEHEGVLPTPKTGSRLCRAWPELKTDILAAIQATAESRTTNP